MPLRFWRIIGGVVGIALTALSVVFLIKPINVIAYYLGYGEEMRVEVVRGTSFAGPDADSSGPGEGRVIGDGRTVEIYSADSGEVVTARQPLISLRGNDVYHGSATVLHGLISQTIAAILFGVFGLPLLLLLAPGWLSTRVESLLKRSGAWVSNR